MKKNKSSTQKNQESGKEKGCSAQTEQPNESISERPSETERKVNDQDHESKYIVLPMCF